MIRILFLVVAIHFGLFLPAVLAQVENFEPVTQQMLLDPSPNDWLMFSRTYDAQRFSPLDQINRENVGSTAHGVGARNGARHSGNHSCRLPGRHLYRHPRIGRPGSWMPSTAT